MEGTGVSLLTMPFRFAVSATRCSPTALVMRTAAALDERDFVLPDDVKRVAPWVMMHRLALAPDAVLDGVTSAEEVHRVLDAVPVPRDADAAAA